MQNDAHVLPVNLRQCFSACGGWKGLSYAAAASTPTSAPTAIDAPRTHPDVGALVVVAGAAIAVVVVVTVLTTVFSVVVDVVDVVAGGFVVVVGIGVATAAVVVVTISTANSGFEIEVNPTSPFSFRFEA